MASAGGSKFYELIEKVKEASVSERNLVRNSKTYISVGIEEPIAWTSMFNYDVNHYFNDPRFYFEQTLRQKLWRWEHIDDSVKIDTNMVAWLGHYPEYTFFGLEIEFDDKGVPFIPENHPISYRPDVSLLEPVNFSKSGWMPRMHNWYDALNDISQGSMKIVFQTWWRGSLDIAVQLRGYENFIIDTMERPEFVHELLGFITKQRNCWYDEYCSYFKCSLTEAPIGDDWVNVPFITPRIFKEFVVPTYLEIEKHHGKIAYIHSCGNQTSVQKMMLELKSLDCFEISPWTDLELSVENIPSDKYIHISVHPNDVLFASRQEIDAKLRSIKSLCVGRSYSVGTSGLTPLSGEKDFIDKINIWLDIAKNIFD